MSSRSFICSIIAYHSTAGKVRNPDAFSIQNIRLRGIRVPPPRGVQSPKELVRIFRRFDHRNAGRVEEFMDNGQEPGRQAETPAQPADLVTMMERPRNRRTVFALASWTAERRPKGWYIRKTDHGGRLARSLQHHRQRLAYDRARTRQGTCQARRPRLARLM